MEALAVLVFISSEAVGTDDGKLFVEAGGGLLHSLRGMEP